MSRKPWTPRASAALRSRLLATRMRCLMCGDLHALSGWFCSGECMEEDEQEARGYRP